MKTILFYIVALLVSLLIFVGLPLLGWGLGDIAQFFANQARLVYVWVILILQMFALWYNPQAGRNQDNRKSGVARHRLDLWLVQIFSLAVVLLAPFSDKRSILTLNIGDAIRFIGFVLLIPGFIFMQLAEKYLDKQFSVEVTVQENHQLIQSGPYQFIRHPRYLGILAFFLGISLVFRSLLTIFIVVALAIVLVWRIYAEESLMGQEFGKEWEAYRSKSWRIIPFVF